MRLIDTNTGDFVEITHPDKVVYAILSHTWSPEGEQSYQEILELRRTLFLHHPQLSLKVKGVCKIARRHGYRYVWIDSACIDKTSSAELSEAINSMYEWYRLADVCYVYLSDVSGKDDPAGINSEFRLSRWHSRGWTLQELIAPKHVLFLTSSWSVLGSKIVLAETLEEITGIDAPVLKHFYLLESICVARRMRWASRRNTTRVEDEAYCLLGIFGIHMPPIYGEGRRAFIRLQQEILKRIPDQTLFAW
ncbi:HET-domain-containing protein, partial [Pilatotrama ljubarskyi]